MGKRGKKNTNLVEDGDEQQRKDCKDNEALPPPAAGNHFALSFYPAPPLKRLKRNARVPKTCLSCITVSNQAYLPVQQRNKTTGGQNRRRAIGQVRSGFAVSLNTAQDPSWDEAIATAQRGGGGRLHLLNGLAKTLATGESAKPSLALPRQGPKRRAPRETSSKDTSLAVAPGRGCAVTGFDWSRILMPGGRRGHHGISWTLGCSGASRVLRRGSTH